MKILQAIILGCVAMVSHALANEAWMTNWEEAKAKAAKENKPILINFTGSDWCGWCIRMDKEVFEKKEFLDYAEKNLVLMLADYPRKKVQSDEVKKQNKELEKQYPFDGYPTVFLLDAEGKKLSGDLGELEGGPEEYVKHLQGLLAKIKKPAEKK